MMNKTWYLKSRHYIYEAKTPDEISVVVDRIQIGSNKEFNYIYVDSPYEVVFIIGVNEKQQILLIKQYRYLVNQTLIEVPAGSPNIGESLEAGAYREFEEEAGYKIGKLIKIGSFYASVGMTNQVNHIFLALDLTRSEQRLEESELIETEWVQLEDAVRLVLEGKVMNIGTAYGLLLASEWFTRKSMR